MEESSSKKLSSTEQIHSLQQQLTQLSEEKRLLEASYEKALTSLADSEAKMETMQSELKLAHSQMTTMWEELSRQQTAGPLSPLPAPESSPELQLQCTLCGDNVRQRDVEGHSQQCSTSSHDRTMTSSMTTDTLLVSVTRTPSAAATWAPFKVITKGDTPWMSSKYFSVFRSQGDFQWLFEALQEECPERIVPPLKAQISLHATVAEFQRFMSRLASHRIYRKHHLFILFLSGSQEDIQSARAKHHPSQQPQDSCQPGQVRDKDSGALVATKEYLSSLEHNLTGLLREMEQSGIPKDCPASYWFKNISEMEPSSTYLKDAAESLSRVCADMEQHQADSEEVNVICQNLESILNYLRAAVGLLDRVEQAVDRFLFWDEEVRICEEVVQDGDNDGEDSGLSETSEPPAANQRWTEVTAHCQEAKDYLEMMCRDLTNELADFDHQKEQELRAVFLEYASLFSGKFQRFQSKWFSLNMILDTSINPAIRAIHFENSNIC
ncbi:uncharacterized protein [Dysidea avara]|uniref:uncharacterized protein isoform X2 n=1 Tax=Dysidea avara TaxID=196820 RepID=UPI00332DC678